MKRRAFLIVCVFLFCLCIGCQKTPPSGQFDAMVEEERLTQDLTALQDLIQPEEIVFYHHGKQETYRKGEPQYTEIFRLNQQRVGTGFRGAEDALQTAWSAVGEKLGTMDVLEYRYQSTYYPIFFCLEMEKQERWVAQQEDGVYGFTGYSVELMDALGVERPDVPAIWSWEDRFSQGELHSSTCVIQEPDEILFYHEGRQVSYAKGSEEFAEIFRLNQQRNAPILYDEHGVQIEVQEPQIEPTDRKWKDEYLQKYDFLEYRYREKPLYSVYFRLSGKEKDNWLAQQEGRGIQMYRNARVSEELLAYLGL